MIDILFYVLTGREWDVLGIRVNMWCRSNTY